jgi:large subunit ribosomal protein L3
MQSVFLAQKSATSQQFNEHSRRVPTTFLRCPEVHLVDVKIPSVDGYAALKFTIGAARTIDKPTAGQLKKAGVSLIPRAVKQVRIRDTSASRIELIQDERGKGVKVGDVILRVGEVVGADKFFKAGDCVDVTGLSKGKGFQGGVKRHGFAGGPKTHGQSDRYRAPGSMGATTTPGRTFKGQRMAGRMGQDKVTVRNLRVLSVTADTITVCGLVPGNPESIVEVRLSKAKYTSV